MLFPYASGNWNNAANAGVFYRNWNKLLHGCAHKLCRGGGSTLPVSLGDCLVADTKFGSPVLGWQRSSGDFNNDAATLIAELVGTKRPAAVFRLVGPIIVDALNRVLARWRRAHVGKKVSKIFAPPVANEYAARPVVFETWVCGIVAALNHACPSVIQRVFSPCFRNGSRIGGSAGDFRSEASTRLRFSSAQANRGHRLFAAAVATTKPLLAAVASKCCRYRRQAPEFLSSQINDLWHVCSFNKQTNYNIPPVVRLSFGAIHATV